MDFLKTDFSISEIVLAVHLPEGKGTPIHKNRTSHGIAFYQNTNATFIFESGERIECFDGDCVFLPEGSSYTVSGDTCDKEREVSVYAINFKLNSGPALRPTVIKSKSSAEIRSLFSRASSAWRKKEIGYYEECMSHLYNIIYHFKKDRSTYSNKKTTLAMLKPALDYINENYTCENISVPKLAAMCGVSEPYLRRLFAKAFSVSPLNYVKNMRINYARELIISGEYQVTDVAMIAGFNDASYFSREYKKAFGISPNATKREQHKY